MSRDRDRILEQALTHELAAAGTPDRDACADAETLAAWADGGLDGAQMAAVELHVSTCARCQAIVGATARSAPLAAGTETAGTFLSSFSWRWWFAPLAATAAAVTLWMVVPQQRDIAVAPTSVAAPATETFAQPQSKDKAPMELSQADTRQAANDVRRKRVLSEPKEESRAAKKQDENAKVMQEKSTIAAAAPAAAPPSAPARAELQKGARLSAAPIEIVSPDPSRRWRIVNGAIERSEDGGASWNATRLQAGEAITGGTAPAPSICWLIGSNGLVMVTADGITFARVPLGQPVALTAVTATDARTAIVTTADGRRFRTDDSGRTWRQIPAENSQLQETPASPF